MRMPTLICVLLMVSWTALSIWAFVVQPTTPTAPASPAPVTAPVAPGGGARNQRFPRWHICARFRGVHTPLRFNQLLAYLRSKEWAQVADPYAYVLLHTPHHIDKRGK